MIIKMVALNWRVIKTYRLELYLILSLILFGWYIPSYMIMPIAMLFSFGVSITSFEVERKDTINLYQSLPIHRKHVVLGKYALALVFMLGGILVSLVMMPLVNIISSLAWNMYLESWLTITAASCLFYAIINLLYFPVLFRVGPVSMLTIIYGSLIPMMIIGGFIGYFYEIYKDELHKLFINSMNNPVTVSGIMFISAILTLLFSYMLSVKIYIKRDC